LGSSLYSGNETTVKRENCEGWNCSEKGEDGFIGREGDGDCFFGILLIDYLEKGKSITGVYYASLLDKLKAEIVTKRPHLKKKKVLLHQDNAPVHTSVVAMSKIPELQFELIDHPPYSPDLATSDFSIS
jgi:hypothetical protein